MAEVIHNRQQHRFELGFEGSEALTAAWYRHDADGHRVHTHTEVQNEFFGQGVGSRLARAVFDDARASGIKLVLKCPSMAGWFARHPQYGDVVEG